MQQVSEDHTRPFTYSQPFGCSVSCALLALRFESLLGQHSGQLLCGQAQADCGWSSASGSAAVQSRPCPVPCCLMKLPGRHAMPSLLLRPVADSVCTKTRGTELALGAQLSAPCTCALMQDVHHLRWRSHSRSCAHPCDQHPVCASSSGQSQACRTYACLPHLASRHGMHKEAYHSETGQQLLSSSASDACCQHAPVSVPPASSSRSPLHTAWGLKLRDTVSVCC